MDRNAGGTKRRVLVMLVLVVLVLSAAAAAEAAARTVNVTSGNYAGKTSERGAVTFKVAHRRIIGFLTYDGYNGSCGQGGGPGFKISITKRSIPINAAGKFSTGITLQGPVRSVPNDIGTLSGSVAGSRVTGKIVNLTQEHHTVCKHGYNETFTAKKT